MHPSRNERRQWSAVHTWGLVVGVGIAVLAFQNVNLRDTARILRELGPLGCLIPLPFGLAQCTETFAWQVAFRTLGVRLNYRRLLRIRLACEGITATCPGGMIVAESIKPGLLARQFGIPTELAVSGTIARKFLLLVSQCGYFGIAALLGIPTIIGLISLSSRGWWLLIAVAIALTSLLAAAMFVGVSLSSGTACKWLHRQLSRIQVAAIRRVLDRAKASFSQTDSRLAEFCSGGPRRLAKPTTIYLIAWLCEALETFTILSLLGVHLDWMTIFLIEVCASMVRNIAFMAPSGIGAQDLSYVGLLQMFAVPNALSVAAAFVLLKRSKEMLWSLVGYWLLAGLSQGSEPKSQHGALRVVLSNPSRSLGA